MNFDAFYDRTALLIAKTGKSLRTIGQESGISYSTLSRLMCKQSTPDISNIVKIATYFGVSIEWLLGLDEVIEGISEEANQVASIYDSISDSDKIIIQAVLARYKT